MDKGTKQRDYLDYARDQRWARLYIDYQKQYELEPRQSDLKSLDLVIRALHQMDLGRPAFILDIGCSTGNFLRLLRAELPTAVLTGGDLMETAISVCRANSDLDGIAFQTMDVFNLPSSSFDVVVANAVNVYFEPADYRHAIQSIARALKPGGYFIGFEWIYLDERELRIVEESEGHPMGLVFWFRSSHFVVESLKDAGFEWWDISPFQIGFDLPRGQVSGLDPHLRTRSKRNPDTGFREQFRGDLFQPWAHIIARRAEG